MALDPSIVLKARDANPLQAFVAAEESTDLNKARDLKNKATEQTIDSTAKELETQSMIDGAIQLNEFLKSGDVAGANRFLTAREQAILARGGDPSDTRDALSRIQAGDLQSVQGDVNSIIELGRQTGRINKGDLTSAMKERQALLQEVQPFLKADGTFDEKNASASALSAARDLNIIAKPGTFTFAERTAFTPGASEVVGDSQGIIEERKKFGQKTGESRAKAIDDGFERIQGIDTNIRNIDRAVEALNQGASTGAIESRFFPTIREATAKLEQVQRELGLDIVGAVTFGALSEGELDLALQTALPTNLEPEALKQFLQEKKESQTKLREYFQNQIDFLDQGGTIAGFLRQQRRQKESGQGDGNEKDLSALSDDELLEGL